MKSTEGVSREMIHESAAKKHKKSSKKAFRVVLLPAGASHKNLVNPANHVNPVKHTFPNIIFTGFTWLAELTGFFMQKFPASYVTGEQMRQGLKPCDTASEAVENPTRFLFAIWLTQSHFSR
jgi:hypothetical protein